ncbi:MAG TPA: hypothetical protein IGS17_12360 [Oscillatoriales cyanobacterium M59_W2019_021]|nr:MAG: hypothetical protein D6728_15840 [Cyanobacteria bacterium J055]HIK33867.1 hypothetical protein [Oscillatoriales cyanobacterium M4454_W2019_049]HIK51695.1 hypothetical protein [Oscillatoriales cyanobacterium M59_W2019_021]
MVPHLVSSTNYSILQVLCPIVILLLVAGLITAIFRAIEDATSRLKKLHQVPCNRCLYFSGCYQLKCAVHPDKALTEEALFCQDFQEASTPIPACSSRCRAKSK